MRRNGSNAPVRQQQGGLSPWSGSVGSSLSPFFGSPWQMMRRMQEDMDRVFGQFFGEPGSSGGVAAAGQPQGQQQWSPRVDISQTDKEWCIEADLPGVQEQDIEAQIQDQYLIIRAELNPEEAHQQPGQAQPAKEGEKHNGKEGQQRQYHQRERQWGYFERMLPLPDNIDEDKVSCDFKNGVLTVHLPKSAEPAPQSRRIPIGGQSQHAAGQQPAMAGSKGGEASSSPEKK